MKDKKISDDAFIKANITSSGGIIINIKSIVLHMFKRHIEKSALEVVHEFNLENICIDIDDYGALDFVIKARTRIAIRNALRAINNER